MDANLMTALVGMGILALGVGYNVRIIHTAKLRNDELRVSALRDGREPAGRLSSPNVGDYGIVAIAMLSGLLLFIIGIARSSFFN